MIGLSILSMSLAGCGGGGGSTEPPVEPPTHEHTWADPTYTWSDNYSSCTAERVCTQDSSHKETETVNSTYTVVTESSCEADGLGRYTVSFKNSAFITQTHDTVIEAFGHDWGTPTYTWSDDYSSCTAERVCLNDSTHKESETVDSIKEETPATYVNTGSIKYTATFEKSVFSTQTYEITLEKFPYHGEVPILNEDGKTLTYGLYPQKNVNDSTLVSALNALTTPESNGWYLYEGDYYAKVSATPYSSSHVFDNSTTIVSGTTYWFKCEPVVWNVLSNNSGEYYVLSSVLLDAHCYYNSTSNRTIDGQTVYPNNYKYSDIRSWLNNDFYNSAFALSNSHIQTTTVDNSAATTFSTSNSYACANTEDKVFLPSYKDYINSSYGFSTSGTSSNTRYCKTTDWARARGAWYSTTSSYLYNGWYSTRSPNSIYNYWVYQVGCDGYIGLNGNVNTTYSSVRPGLSIKIA